MATAVPRTDFRSNLISFGHAGLSTDELFAAIQELIERLQFREGMSPDQRGAPVVDTKAPASR